MALGRGWAVGLLAFCGLAHAQEPATPSTRPTPVQASDPATTPPALPVARIDPAPAAPFRIGGVVQFDVVNYALPQSVRSNLPGSSPLEDAVTFRRVRLNVGGSIDQAVDYFAEINFVDSLLPDLTTNSVRDVPAPTALWVTFRDLPVGNLRVGQQRPPLSFEHLAGGTNLPLFERSLGYDAFVENFNNGYEPGILLFDTFADRRGTWAFGAFKNTHSLYAYNIGRNEHELTGRVTGLPVDADGGRTLVHVGVGGTYRDLDDDAQRFRARPSIRNTVSALGPLLADTGAVYGSRQAIVVPELVVVRGPLSVQCEYYGSWLTDARPASAPGGPAGTVFFQAVTAEAGYLLTGEARQYDRDAGVFERVVPAENVRWRKGFGREGAGVWQAAARLTYLDLNDKGIEGGQVYDLTLGLTWYLNPNLKIQTNYSLTYRNAPGTAGDGYINAVGTRLAVEY
ncbi:MAG: porin [Gemmataceae bacterium]